MSQATKLEVQGRIKEAIKLYRRVAVDYSGTPASKDAEISIAQLEKNSE